MPSINRRHFLQHSGLGAGGLLLGDSASARGQSLDHRTQPAGRGAATQPVITRIVVTEEHPVLRTAAAELNRALGTTAGIAAGAVPAAGDAVLALVSNPVVRPLIESGRTNLHNIAPEQDGFHVLEQDGVVWFLGSSWRGVLQGVHGLTAGPGQPGFPAGLEFQGSFALPTRIFSPVLGSQLFTSPASTPAVLQRCMRYLSRMGASHAALTHDFCGGPARDLHAYVDSRVFPDAADPALRTSFRKTLRALIDAAKGYGLEVLFDARLLPCQGGPWVKEEDRQRFLSRYPAEVLSDCGTYQGKVLCFGHPQVRAFFAEVIGRFLGDFPEISLFHYLTMDAEGEFCDPVSCPRCHGLSKFEQRDRLARFLEQEMTRARPGLRILNTSFQWDREQYGFDQLLTRQSALPAAVGLCLSATGDSATFERQAHHQLRQARDITRRAGQWVIGRDALHAFEDQLVFGTTQRIDYPLGVFAKIRRWHDLGYDGFYDVRGRFSPDDLHANSVACRAALLDPAAAGAAFADELALRWFGAEAGPLVAHAWRLLEQAQAVRSNGYAFPSSSPLCEYVPWHFRPACAPVPTRPEFGTRTPSQQAEGKGELVPARANGYIYHDGDYPRRLDTTGHCLVDSARLFKAAADLLGRARVLPLPARLEDASSWLGTDAGQSPRAYLDAHGDFVANSHFFGAVMGAYFILKAMRMRLGDDAAAYRLQAEPWLVAYAKAAGALASQLEDQLAKGRIKSLQGSHFTPESLRGKAKEVTDYLAATVPPTNH